MTPFCMWAFCFSICLSRKCQGKLNHGEQQIYFLFPCVVFEKNITVLSITYFSFLLFHYSNCFPIAIYIHSSLFTTAKFSWCFAIQFHLFPFNFFFFSVLITPLFQISALTSLSSHFSSSLTLVYFICI